MELEIVRPTARIVRINPSNSSVLDRNTGIEALQWIEYCARISHRSEERQILSTDPITGTWDRFVRTVVLGHGDWSVVEHASASVLFDVDRGITHELVRHRLFSYTQESTRFVNYDKKGTMRIIEPAAMGEGQNLVWCKAMESAKRAYLTILEDWPPQIARSVLPNALASRIMMTGNLRAWRWFLLMRTTKEAHPQMKEVAIPLLQEFQELIPILFEDIKPEARQADNAKLPH